MNEDVDQQIERLLRQAGPVLKGLQQDKGVAPPRVHEAIAKVLDEVFPLSPELTVSQMRALILTLLEEHPMDGSELCSRLRKANIRLKEPGAGSGAIYGILRQFEKLRFISSEKREIDGQFLDVYSPTPDGRNELHPEAPESTQVAQWAHLVLAVQM